MQRLDVGHGSRSLIPIIINNYSIPGLGAASLEITILPRQSQTFPRASPGSLL